MIKKIISALFLASLVSAKSSFIGDTNRAKIFELTDNEIATFKLTMPDEKFALLKENCQFVGGNFVEQLKELFNNPPPMIPANNTEAEAGPGPAEEEEAFKTKDATLVVQVNGEEKSFKKITFSLGGSSSRIYGRQGFNLKIRGNKDLYGRSQFRIRSDAREATYLRSKLSCDIHNRLGLTSISANYITLYINEEYLGMYILMDAPKLPWIEQVYGEADTPNLYKCKDGSNYLSVMSSAELCYNENEDVTDRSEWVEFLTALDNAQSAEDIEDIFEVDQFLNEIALEYLTGSWDHFLSTGHNFSMYKQKSNGKWTIIYYDFDADFGQDVDNIEFGLTETDPNKDFPNYSFGEWDSKRQRIIEILIFKDPTRFLNILRKIVTEVFNPATLFAHIDELKEFIKPHVIKDKTADEIINRPGVLNKKGSDYSIEQWDANSEFTTIQDTVINSSAYGLKYWILAKYRYVCKTYKIECDQTYLDENYEYPVNKDVEGEIITGIWDGINFAILGFGSYKTDDIIVHEDSQAEKPTETSTEAQPTETTNDTKPAESTPAAQTYQCMAEIIGYPCCDKNVKTVYEKDVYGDWGYDFKKGEWCGLTPYTEQTNDEECWSEVFGYPCCKGCYVYETDDDGK